MGDGLPEHIRNDIHKLIADSASANRIQAYGLSPDRPTRNWQSAAKPEVAVQSRKQGLRRPQTANSTSSRVMSGRSDLAAQHGLLPSARPGIASSPAKQHNTQPSTQSTIRAPQTAGTESPRWTIEHAKGITWATVEKDLALMASSSPEEQKQTAKRDSTFLMHGMQDALLRESYNSTVLALKSEIKESKEARLHLQDQLKTCHSRMAAATRTFAHQREGLEARLAEEALQCKHIREQSLSDAKSRLAECKELHEEKCRIELKLKAAEQEKQTTQQKNARLEAQNASIEAELRALREKNGSLSAQVKELEEEMESAQEEKQYILAQSHDFEDDSRHQQEMFSAKLKKLREKRGAAVEWLIRVRDCGLLVRAFFRWNLGKTEARLLFAVWAADAQKAAAEERGAEVEELKEQLVHSSRHASLHTSTTVEAGLQDAPYSEGAQTPFGTEAPPSSSNVATSPQAVNEGSSAASQERAPGSKPRYSVPEPVQIALHGHGSASAASRLQHPPPPSEEAPPSHRSFFSSDSVTWHESKMQGMEVEEMGSEADFGFLQAEDDGRTGRLLTGLERSREGLSMLQRELAAVSTSVREELVEVYLKYAGALRALGQLKQARKMYERVLQIREMEPGVDCSKALTPVWIKAGRLSFHLCDLDSAVAFFSKAYKTLTEDLGVDHADARRAQRHLQRAQKAQQADLYHARTEQTPQS